MSNDYKVGYGRPPKASQFKKGQSGNPRGSSRKARTRQRRQSLPFHDIVLEDAFEIVRMREGNNRIRSVSLREALLKKEYSLAFGGNRLALKHVLDRIDKAEQTKREEILEHLEIAINYKENYPAAAKRCADRGLPPPLPHPDDTHLNHYTGKITVTGPRTHEELVELKALLKARNFFMTELEGRRSDIEACAREGFPPTTDELELVTRIETYLDRCNSKLEGRGWLPRIAGESEEK